MNKNTGCKLLLVFLQDLEFSRLVLDSHSLAKTHLLSSLLSIFIEIEFTGESMEFEDKFGRWLGQ